MNAPQDGSDAVKWFRKEAEQGDPSAQYLLGLLHDEGKIIPQDENEAVKWYRKAALQGNVLAQFNLGLMYHAGMGVQRDHLEAMSWYRKSADQGNVPAQFYIGLMYAKGHGVSRDDREAMRWIRQAAEQGNASAQYHLGLMYFEGVGVPKNDDDAVFWCRKAAEQGYSQAQYTLGTIYTEGDGIPPNPQEAVGWFRKAAESGDTRAQRRLGLIYADGDGVKQDFKEAVKWYRKAAKQDGVLIDADEGNHRRLWRTFLFNIGLVILVFILGSFVGMLSSHEKMIEAEMLSRARAHFKDIVMTRQWNASYGGVYVEKREGVFSSPYLKNPDITSTSGKVYTLKNPALMTRELSELSQKTGNYQFRITSLNLRNPNNAPDPWEKEALLAFNEGLKEKSTILPGDAGVLFRYMAPLVMDDTCLGCHQDQGYKVGDIRGGISVTFDITQIQANIDNIRIMSILLTAFLFSLLMGAIYVFVAKLYRKLDDALRQLKEMATVDPLTGLFNRRYFYDRLENEVGRHKRHGRDLSCIFIDLDHFKKINDCYGHATGDEALRSVARLLRTRMRSQDICARYGGEELVVLLPDTPISGARVIAEQLRLKVAENPIAAPAGATFYLTASFGVASVASTSQNREVTAEELISQADKAVYLAKSQGRNRVVVAGEE